LAVLVAAEEINRRFEAVCAEHNITVQQYNVLRILRGAHPDGHPRCDIMDRMIQRAPDVTRLINRLVSQGYAMRDRSHEDGRLSITVITQKGLDLLETMQADMSTIERELASRLSPDDVATLARLCDVLIQP
ncbi:MAG: hypothetical protein J5I53_10025, partial [Bradyrhizobiaceae bacterium]|nr:hypothetical protein [Bradyrhizobiaceae bacterium]